MSDEDEVNAEVRAAHAAVARSDPPAKVSEMLTRVTAAFAMRVLELVDFHHIDEEIGANKLDPRFVGPVRRSVPIASPALFPQALRPLVSSLREHLSALEAALVRSNVESAKAESHEAHERFHELQREVNEWLARGMTG